MISPFYGINPAQAENPYLFLYLFQGLNDIIMSYQFTGIIILEGGRTRSERSKRTGGRRAKIGGPTRLQYQAACGTPFTPPASVCLLLSLLGHPRSKIMIPVNL